MGHIIKKDIWTKPIKVKPYADENDLVHKTYKYQRNQGRCEENHKYFKTYVKVTEDAFEEEDSAMTVGSPGDDL